MLDRKKLPWNLLAGIVIAIYFITAKNCSIVPNAAVPDFGGEASKPCNLPGGRSLDPHCSAIHLGVLQLKEEVKLQLLNLIVTGFCVEPGVDVAANAFVIPDFSPAVLHPWSCFVCICRSCTFHYHQNVTWFNDSILIKNDLILIF
jgi:hypothetical protein